MYAVGKVGSLISRSVYSVSGPFHPFGGAVDVVVVQQQDGSFKSSPWYVRFGKFQGVLKSREKVVDISVNGVEAGFHMYLDSNGEAYFLRNADPNDEEEGEFIVSPASSGDEREVPIQEAQLRKSKSTSCDSSTMEADVGEGKILARTTSRQTTILERMFGRKSVKNNAHAVDRVSSLERAEIAAELLDTKWSTNLPRSSKTNGSNDEPSKSNLAEVSNNDQMETSKPNGSTDEPSKSNLTEVSNNDQIETSKPVFSEHSLDHGKEMDSDCNNAHCNSCSPRGGRNSSAHETDQCLQATIVKKEVVEIHTCESSNFTDNITSITHQHGSESLSNDLGTDKLTHQSVDTQDELLHDVEDVNGRETHTEEVISNVIFEIHVVETDIISGKSEVVSEIVTVDSDGANQNFTDSNYQNYVTTDISAERHEVSLIPSAHDAVQEKIVILSSSETVEGSLDAVQEKVVILSSSETVESSYAVPCILDDTVHDASDISQSDSVQHEEHSSISDVSTEKIISEESSLVCYGAPSNKKDLVNVVVQECEAFISENPAPQILEENGPDMDVSTDSVSLSHADAAHDLACQHVSSSVVETPSYELDIGPEDVTKNSIVENEACSRELVVSVIQTSMGDGLTECIAQPTVFSNKIEVEGSPTAVGFSSLVSVEVQNTKLEDDTNKSSSVIGDEVGFAPEATAELDEEAEPVVSFSEYTEEIQFQFSDTENFADRKATDDMVANKTTGEVEHDESDCDTKKQEGGDVVLANDLENCSDSVKPVTSPVSIPAIDFQSGDSNIEAKSLPNLRSHIHDLERSDSFQLSCSLQSNAENNGVDPVKSTSNAENNGVDPVKSTNSAFLEQKSEVIGDSEENTSPPEVTSNVAPDGKHADDLKVDAFIPFTELSLCRHLLSEGMGEDAACSAFDSEKVTLEKFRDMKQSLMRNNKLVVRIAGRYFPWDAAAPIVLGMISFSEEQVFEPKGMIKVEQVEQSEAPGGSWRIWPFSFRRTRTISAIQPVCESTVETSVSTPKESTPIKELDRERNKSRAKRIERKVRSLTPTSEELASLDLREGRNVLTFTFSTAIVGKQQVDCHIYLWKWNTRIVISDVDGTITKSDVLGQFMPLVGVDWSQNGVAHLFSAIKENGYQLLFLSARAISQAHITRQFLFNLKQDGKALPDGPVVISPDGLFPSLYREVIRRAPHEFKISCLEAIKDLFPHDSNPFYAGFGNRDTDELSYLKVGIPMGKIFIINPKGEVAVNRRVDTKSYTSLHALVHGMFPPISSSSEQEDYNAWNYWKMPLPDVDL
ncbi:phosphatidate phosphatase PAH2-like [Miscanthus floridulus]|uniref:phosphatidate phosphatase PAH2-like n=1 Tax=Miscanthus floridulus TaxID=154761 RepID=UPI00345826CB